MWGTDMGKIPNDIMDTAYRVWREDIPAGIDAGPEVVEYFARAILAERQACEKIARDRAERFKMPGSSHPNMREFEARTIADLIAARSAS